MKLSECLLSKSLKIVEINCGENIRERLAILGVLKGCKIIVVRKAPFNGPIEIKTRDFYLAIRKSQADKIFVEYYD